MKFIAALSALLSAAAVSAAPTTTSARQAPPEEFHITDFKAGTLPNADGAAISFTFTLPNTTNPLTTVCSYSDTTSTTSLPDVTPYRPCASDNVEWQFRKIPLIPVPGFYSYLLTVVYEDEQGRRYGGGKEFPSGQFPIQGGEEVYVGEEDFVITV